MESYKDLKAWQLGMDLVDAAYRAIERLPTNEMYVLGAQIRKAANSIPSNIAEGKGRRTLRDYRHFVIQAEGRLTSLKRKSSSQIGSSSSRPISRKLSVRGLLKHARQSTDWSGIWTGKSEISITAPWHLTP